MSFVNVIERLDSFDIEQFNRQCTPETVLDVLSKKKLSEHDLCVLLSDAASRFIEPMALRAQSLTKQHFGNAVFIFTPLYISNYCDNVCPYCSFAHQHNIARKHLSLNEIERVADTIIDKGIRHLLILTGESRRIASPEYIYDALSLLNKKFSSISIEIYALTDAEYKSAADNGADGLTIYQETYDRTMYDKLHSGGPKNDYEFRLEAPERAAVTGFRSVTVGALFGLAHWRNEAFVSALHAHYLQKRYPSLEVSISFPRLRPLAGEFSTEFIVKDKQFVQMLTAIRMFLPTVGITMSTRESEQLRNAVLPLGVTKMSAGVSTAVGGHGDEGSTAQFEIADERSVEQVKNDLLKSGYQPVMHDWNRRYIVRARDEIS